MATNVVEPLLTAVTNVGLDHARMLGETVKEIAREKAGILKRGVPAFTTIDDPVALAVLAEEAATREAILHQVPSPEGRVELDRVSFHLVTRRWGGLDLESPLTGRHQLRNLALAVHGLEALPPRLPVSAEAVTKGVGQTRLPGRFQVEADDNRIWILDIAHNLDAVQALTDTIGEVDPPHPRVGVVGILADKPWREMLKRLEGVVDELILIEPTSAPNGRAWDPEVAADSGGLERVHVSPGIGPAIQAAPKGSRDLGNRCCDGLIVYGRGLPGPPRMDPSGSLAHAV